MRLALLPRPILLAATLGAGCTLFVETGDLQMTSGATSATSTSTGSVTTGAGGDGNGGAGGDPGGGGAGAGGGTGIGGEGGGTGIGGEGGSASWCVANAPQEALLCADFDTAETALTNPPWSNEVFEDEQGSIRLDMTDPRSAPASARIELVDEALPDCGFQALQRNLAGVPDRLRIRFDLRAEDVGATALVATLDWRTQDEVDCMVILGLSTSTGSVQEQQFAETSGFDDFDIADSPLSGWHTVEWTIDSAEGRVEVAIDGRPMFFKEADDYAMDLTLGCSDPPQPASARVRLGPHCEELPFAASYDNVVLAPF